MIEAHQNNGAIAYDDDHEFRLAMDAAGIGAWRWDVATAILHLSDAAQVLLGFPDEAPTYSAFLDRVHPGDRATVDRAMHATIDQGAACDLDFRASSASGIRRWLHKSGRAHGPRGGPQDHALLLGRKSAVEKVAAFLMEWAAHTPGTDMVALAMTRQDIADYLGLTIETVSRTLSQLERDAMIELSTARQIRFQNPAALRALNA